ncbi:Protein asteroid -like protein 1 [Halotydeus destructor]|nr:Protein asteroid -like protein 1 [Halotydeus destructor]
MGIQTFTSFVHDNVELFTEEFELKNTELVLDGVSLMRFMARVSKEEQLNAQFGGNYVHYAEILSRFIKKLKADNVQAYVIFEPVGRAGTTVEERRKREKIRHDRLLSVVELSKELCEAKPSMSNGTVDSFPMLIMEAVKGILREHNVPCIRTLTCSDSTIAHVANELNCPVFSGDSNNYMYDLKGGYVNFTTFDYDSDKAYRGDEPLKCRIFHRAKFLRTFDIRPEVLPLFAVVIGNNYRKREFFANGREDVIFGTIKQMRTIEVTAPQVEALSGVKRRIVQLLSWLKGKYLRTATAEFCYLMNDPNMDCILRDAIDLTADNFKLSNALSCALNHLKRLNCDLPHGQVFEEIDGTQGIMLNDMATRFIDEIWIKEIIEIKARRRVCTKLDIDHYGRPSSMKTAKSLFQFLIAISCEGFYDYKPIKIVDWRRTETDITSCGNID